MALTPVDILHMQFKTSIRGYNKQQVDEFIKSVTGALETALREKTELQKKVNELQEEVARIRGLEASMSSALTMAQKSAEEMKLNAHRQAEMIIKEAEQARVRMTIEAQQEAEKCRAEAALLQATRDRLESEMRALLNGYLEWLDRRTGTDSIREVKELQSGCDVNEIEEVKGLQKIGNPELPGYSSEVA